ncbi:hypothetical protein NUW58_g3531 [Xylaria curta]|uniref:Uncharacterized protein n=1 Tax=Xylaria curta TaxID=42375 RepID=A0ACC1PC26_9PEZI|nr:hypothetical protein NUW58_g3531 [Xylaria curta]
MAPHAKSPPPDLVDTLIVGGGSAEQLGLVITPQGDLVVKPPFNETTSGGCFAASDNPSFLKTTPNTTNIGANSAAGVASHVQSRRYGLKSLSELMQAQKSV